MYFNFIIKNINIFIKDKSPSLSKFKNNFILDINHLIFFFFKITKKVMKVFYKIFKQVKINWFNLNDLYLLKKKKHELPYKIYLYKKKKITIIRVNILYDLKLFYVFHYYKILSNIYSLTIKQFFFISLLTKYV